MTAKQLRKFLEEKGWSQTHAADVIGISSRHMRRYVAGEAAVPQCVEYALRYAAGETYFGDLAS